ncbi:MAG: hypothetical protein GY865_11915 [candidate division Zixibacteria bacterium]|nr:hypothetical protein [candidate division Zixibacteria bacterium]
MQYHLGIAYEASGKNKKAVIHFEKFLDYWKNGEMNIFEIDDARERLHKLK